MQGWLEINVPSKNRTDYLDSFSLSLHIVDWPHSADDYKSLMAGQHCCIHMLESTGEFCLLFRFRFASSAHHVILSYLDVHMRCKPTDHTDELILVDEILLPRTTNFRGFPFNVEMASPYLKLMFYQCSRRDHSQCSRHSSLIGLLARSAK